MQRALLHGVGRGQLQRNLPQPPHARRRHKRIVLVGRAEEIELGGLLEGHDRAEGVNNPRVKGDKLARRGKALEALKAPAARAAGVGRLDRAV
jgi:hypothetical protein